MDYNSSQVDWSLAVLDDELRSRAIRSLKALKAHLGPQGHHHEAVYLIIDTKKPTSSDLDLVPRIIPLPHAKDTHENMKIMLITKDPVVNYRTPLEQKGSPTEDVFGEIVSLKKFKLFASNPKQVKKLYYEYDLLLADHRVYKLLPSLIGRSPFYKNNKRLPLMVQMARPSPDAQLVKSKKSTKMKDERVEPDYVLRQVKTIARSTTFVPSTGTCLSIIIGYSDFKLRELIENMDAVLEYLISPKFKPVGGVIKKGMAGIEDLHLKTSESVSLPVMEKKKNEAV
ncbi:hypothetical protein KL944_000086 [Ogataea haglerorum]|nr:hypothetical protein KL944_000086 [Ogataea haglerorum]